MPAYHKYTLFVKLDEIQFFFLIDFSNMNAILSTLSLSLLVIAVYGITFYYEDKHISKCKIVYRKINE